MTIDPRYGTHEDGTPINPAQELARAMARRGLQQNATAPVKLTTTDAISERKRVLRIADYMETRGTKRRQRAAE